jgi:predicted ATPase
MITKLMVSNFKSLRELECEFGRLTVIVGPNGCGKSSVLQAIETVRDWCSSESGEVEQTLGLALLSRPAVGGESLKSIGLCLNFSTQDGDRFIDVSWKPGIQRPRFLSSHRNTDVLNFAPTWASDLVMHIELYRFDRAVMAEPAYSEEATPTVGPDGANLPAVLDALQGNQREHFEAIEERLRELVPGLRRIRVPRVKMDFTRKVLVGDRYQDVKDSAVGHQIRFDFNFAQDIAADQASEGTLLLLGLLTVIGVESGPPTTIMLDDLDRGLHPKAQKQLVAHLRQLLDSRPDLQIIATTHSPYLVEHLKYEEVLAMTQSPVDGRSLIAPLANHPDADRWKDEMSAGEFWSSVGEDWVAGER